MLNKVFLIAGSLVIFISNFAIEIIINALRDFLKFKDVNQELSFKINNLMVSQFFNTAIIILILEATFEGYGVVTAVSYIPSVSMNAKYYDYSATWFFKIGIKLIITMLIYVVSPNLVEIVMLPF